MKVKFDKEKHSYGVEMVVDENADNILCEVQTKQAKLRKNKNLTCGDKKKNIKIVTLSTPHNYKSLKLRPTKTRT